MVRVVCAKIPRPLVFACHVDAEVRKAWKPMGATSKGFEVIGGGTRLAMPKTICMPDTSSLKSGSGATEGVLD